VNALPRLLHRRPNGSGVLVALAVLAALAALSSLGLRGEAPPRTQEQVAHQIASQLRCPVCEDLSAADSPAPLARQMRVQIDEKLSAGDSPAEIRQSFIAAYGNSVLMTPPHEGVSRLVYAFPLLALMIALLSGTVLLRRSIRRGRSERSQPGEAELSAADRRRVELALAQLRKEER
jgi:cytochrome c-type biogenesis protein CcmH